MRKTTETIHDEEFVTFGESFAALGIGKLVDGAASAELWAHWTKVLSAEPRLFRSGHVRTGVSHGCGVMETAVPLCQHAAVMRAAVAAWRETIAGRFRDADKRARAVLEALPESSSNLRGRGHADEPHTRRSSRSSSVPSSP